MIIKKADLQVSFFLKIIIKDLKSSQKVEKYIFLKRLFFNYIVFT